MPAGRRRAALVSLAGIAELRGIARSGRRRLRIGAMTPPSRDRRRRRARRRPARDPQRGRAQIANPVVRNMGTIGGSIAFADPAADYPPALVAADADDRDRRAASGTPARRRPRFLRRLVHDGAASPARSSRRSILPPAPPGSRRPLRQARPRQRRFRHRLGGARASPPRRPRHRLAHRGRRLRPDARATAPRPRRRSSAARSTTPAIADAGAALAAAADPVDDVRASAAYRRLVMPAPARPGAWPTARRRAGAACMSRRLT